MDIVEKPGTLESVGIIDKQINAETETLPACRFENGSTLASNGEAKEEKYEEIVSMSLKSSVDSANEALSGEILSPLQEDVHELREGDNHSNSCQSGADRENAEEETACEVGGNISGIVRENGELPHGSTEAPFGHEDPHTTSEGIFNPTLKEESNKPLSASLHSPGRSLETGLSPKANGGYPREDVFDQAYEALGSHTSMGANDALSFADFSEHQLPTQEISTAVVSTDLNGWQRFDAGESEVNGVLGLEQTINEASQKQLELWEQLLEDGLEGSAQCIPTSTVQVEAEIGIDSSVHDGNQFWLASPGNPFIEGLERSSNFSEADGFITNPNFVRSLSLHEYGVDASFKEGLIQSDDVGKEKYPGIADDNNKLAEDNLGSRFDGKSSDGSKKIAQQRFPSFSDIRSSPSRPGDTSFLSFKEQEPAHRFDADGEKWEANFDEPSIQEGPRSLSLPREAGDSQRQKGLEAPLRSHSQLLGFLSPKLSPRVKKVASKVRTTPDRVVNADRQGRGSKAVDKKESRKGIWRCCICCSHGN